MTELPSDLGTWMHDLARRLWPIPRSITGAGVRETLRILKEQIPDLVIHEVPTGTQVFDWKVPQEWSIRSAQLIGPDGQVIADWTDCNLHVLGYSTAVDVELSLDELQPHLHSLPDQPNAIPYVTSYHNRNWGFALAHDVRSGLRPGNYRASIDTSHFDGSLTYGELVIPGDTTDEIFISTYVCHPSMANNELSGPVVATALARAISELPTRHYTYRFAFVPETIGALTFGSINREHLRANVVAAFNLTCIGDDRAYTYLASRLGNLRLDRIAQRAIRGRENAVTYSYLARGSDERHYGAPGMDLPIISLMRSRYADYPEYHTSLDDLDTVVTPSGLQGGLEFVYDCIREVEERPTLFATQIGEPQLGRRGLYHQIMGKTVSDEIMLRTNILAYADGQHDEVDMAELFGVPLEVIETMVDELVEHDLIRRHHQSNHLHPGVMI